MIIDILTLFPEMFVGPFAESIVKRAVEKGKVEIKIHNLRDWSTDSYKTVDDKPYGGGAGMIMKVDVVDRAIENLKLETRNLKLKTRIILLDTKGEMYSQKKAQKLNKIEHLILICGHYEGLDHRIHEHIADEVICIGPYVLTGAEIPAMAVVDSVVRLIPGVIKKESLVEESFSQTKNWKLETGNFDIEYKQYTRPAEYKGWKVPEVLLNGNHKEIEEWRKGERGNK